MYLNQFSVRVPEGKEVSGSYVEMEHGETYSLVLRNDRSVRCDAEVSIDGKHIGTFRIGPHDSMRLERPVDDQGRFTFYESGSDEAGRSGESYIPPNEKGLVKVTFTPECRWEAPIPNHPFYQPDVRPIDPWPPNTTWVTSTTSGGAPQSISNSGSDGTLNLSSAQCSNTTNSGITGLSGSSNQQFYQTGHLSPDYTQQTTIHLRLVKAPEQSEPRPLRPAMTSNPVPPPVN